MKLCTKCNIIFSLNFFVKKKGGKHGVNSVCRSCRSLLSKEYNKNNVEINKIRGAIYRSNNKEKLKASSIIYREKNKDKLKKLKKEPTDQTRLYHRNYTANQRRTNIQFKLSKNLRTRLNKALKSNYKNGSAVKDLGCSIDELKLYFESKFQEGMSWNNYGNKEGQWSIDHIVPLSRFNLQNREEFLKACHYTNLQPMWHIENQKKSNL